MIDRLRQRARSLKRETYALYLAVRDPRTPWYARVLGVLVVGYALSPIDLIPDFIPVLGYLDDLLLVPLGIAVVLKLAERAGVELPIARQVHAVLFEGKQPQEAIVELMAREATTEG